MDKNIETNNEKKEIEFKVKDLENFLKAVTDDAFDTMENFTAAQTEFWHSLAKDNFIAFSSSSEKHGIHLAPEAKPYMFYVLLMLFGRSFEKLNRAREERFRAIMDKEKACINLHGKFRREKDGKMFWGIDVINKQGITSVLVPATTEEPPMKMPADAEDKIQVLEDQLEASKDVINTLLAMDDEQKNLIFNIVDDNQGLLDDMIEFRDYLKTVSEMLDNAIRHGKGDAGHDR